MEDGVIRCKLDLLLNMKDATTGLSVEERDVRFIVDDEPVLAHGRGEGAYVFLNWGRETCLMHIEVYGYEPKTITVDYEKLDPVLPAIDVFLIPSENTRRGEPLLTLKGRLSGLCTVEAIHPGRSVTSIREFDAKKRIMTVFTPNRRMNLTDVYYGIFHADQNAFEPIEVFRELSDKKVRLKNNLEMGFVPNSPICRIVCGQVEEDGTYLLRVRDDGKNLKYLVRYIVGDETRYKVIDFHNLEGVELD
jgi:hypothetical protein